MQNRSWTRSWPAFAIVSAKAWSVRSRTIAAASASGLSCSTRSPVTPSSIISGIPPTSDATTGRDSAIASRIDRPWASRMRRQDRDVERGGDRRDVVAAAGEDDPMGDAVGGRATARARRAASPRRRSAGTRPAPRAGRAARRRSASGGPSRAPAGRRRRRSASRAPSRTRRGACSTAPGGRSAGGRRRCRSAGPARRSGRSSAILRSIDFETAISWSISGRQLAERLAVLGGADPRRVDGRDDVRPRDGRRSPSASDRLRPDDVGAVHVGVDDVRPDVGEVGGQRARPRPRRRARR